MSEQTPTPEEKAGTKSKPAGKTDTEAANATNTTKASEAKEAEKQLKAELLRLCDEFSQFNEECAFICDAFAAIVREPETIDQATIAGFSHYSIWLKDQVAGFKQKIHQVHKGLGQ